MKPILFSVEMVRAILEGRKKMMRRVIKPQPPEYIIHAEPLADGFEFYDRTEDAEDAAFWPHDGNGLKCPYPVGTILWVRETFENYMGAYNYKAGEYGLLGEKWKPSIFMPKEACRIFLKIRDVKVERLQDISEEDAIAEGVQENICGDPDNCPSSFKIDGCCGKGEYFRYPVNFDQLPCYSARESFQTLWQSINGKESWQANPFCWCLTFERTIGDQK